MAKTIPPIEEWVANYAASVAVGQAKFVKRFLAANDISGKAKSDAAETAWATNTQAAIAARQRQKGLAGVTDSDIKDPVQRDQGAAYAAGVRNKSPKLGKKAAKYVPILQAAVNALPARTADAAANVAARVTPIAVALQNAKRGGA